MATDIENTEHDPYHQSAKIRSMLTGIIDHAREDVAKVSDPQARALFETTAEVLTGLRTAFEHFERGTEEAWRKPS